MLHEDRILRSIDLLTFNARETLNKYVEWASTSNSNVTFNLFDALSSYKDNGTTGSAVYLKPLTIPSFKSISSGIFGDEGTSASRDIFWNFDFVSNGTGWSFNEYIATNGGVAKSTISPKLSINVDTTFGNYLSGKPSTLYLNNTFFRIKYANNAYYTLNITNTGTLLINEDIKVFGRTYLALSGKSVSIGSYSSSGTTYDMSDTIYVDSKSINVRRYDGTKFLNTLSDFSKLVLGSSVSPNDTEFYTNDFNHYILNSKSYAVSLRDPDNASYIIAYDGDSKNGWAFSTPDTTPINTAYVGNGIYRIASRTQEAFQFFVKNSSDLTGSTYDTMFDVWVEGGIDNTLISRNTSTYYDFYNSVSDASQKALNKTNPYYLNVGTKGVLTVQGKDKLVLTSNNNLDIKIGNGSEISISKGSVIIPNLELTQYQRIGLSTLTKHYEASANGPTKVFPVASYDINSDSVAISTEELLSFKESTTFDDHLFNTFNSDTQYEYSYSYYTESSIDMAQQARILYCKTFKTALGSAIDINNPVSTTIITSFEILEDYKINVASGIENTYAVLISGTNPALMDLYYSLDRGNTFNKREIDVSNYFTKISLPYIKTKITINSIKISVSSNNSAVNCDPIDSLWFLVEYTVQNDNTLYYSLIYYNMGTTFSDYANVPSNYNNYFNTTNQYNMGRPSSFALANLGSIYYNNKDEAYLIIDRKQYGSNNTNDIIQLLKYEITVDGLKYDGTKSVDAAGLRDQACSLFTSELIIRNDATNNKVAIQNIYLRYYQQNRSNVKTYIPNQITLSYDFSSVVVDSIVTYTETRGANIQLTSTKGICYDTTGNEYYQKITYFRYSPLTSGISAYLMTSKYINSGYNIIIITNFNSSGVAYILPLSYNSYTLINYNYIIYSSYPTTVYPSTETFSYNDAITNTVVSVSTMRVKNYDSYFTASYIDTFGILGSINTSISYIGSFKNNKLATKITSYMLDSNNVSQYISKYVSRNGTVIGVASINSSSNNILFNYAKLVNSSNDVLNVNSVNYILTKNDIEIANTNVPYSITYNTNSTSIDISRKYGIASAIVKNTTSSDISAIQGMIPLEAISLFTKRAYNSNTTYISRDDFNIKFINKPTNIEYRGGTLDSEYIYAELIFNTYDSNSGHNLKLISSGDIDKTAVSTFTYEGTNPATNIYHLIYDITNNRTFAIIANSDYSARLYPLNLTMFNKGIVINIDSSLVNTYDTNFNDYYSIRNEKSNVVSIRCDYLNSIRMNFNKSTYQLGLICGFTEINNQEGDC